MLYTEKEKTEIERVRKVFAEHLQQSTILSCYGLIKWALSGWRLA